MLSFRINDDDAQAATEWAERLGIDRSQLIREAVRHHLNRLRAEDEIEAWAKQPLTDDERALEAVAYWGPVEDWSDWADAAR